LFSSARLLLLLLFRLLLRLMLLLLLLRWQPRAPCAVIPQRRVWARRQFTLTSPLAITLTLAPALTLPLALALASAWGRRAATHRWSLH
jgi:hypothetical protein